MRIPTRMATVAALATVAAATVLPALPATAKAGDVVRRGACSGAADWKLKAGSEDNRIEVEAEVDSNKAGQVWTWRLLHNGSLSAKGTSTTAGTSGSFTVRRKVTNLAGADNLKFRAVRSATGEVCSGSLTF